MKEWHKKHEARERLLDLSRKSQPERRTLSACNAIPDRPVFAGTLRILYWHGAIKGRRTPWKPLFKQLCRDYTKKSCRVQCFRKIICAGNENSQVVHVGTRLVRSINKKRPFPQGGKGRHEKSVLALTSSLCFFLALNAGLFIMLALANFSQNACAGTLTFKPFQCAFQGFILADTYLGHCYPSPRSSRLNLTPARRTDGDRATIISLSCMAVNRLFARQPDVYVKTMRFVLNQAIFSVRWRPPST